MTSNELRTSGWGVYLQSLLESFGLLRRSEVWMFFLPQFASGWGVLLLLTFFTVLPMSGSLANVLEIFGGDRASHYPEHFWQLPYVVSALEPPLWAIFAGWGWVAFLKSTPALYMNESVEVRAQFQEAFRSPGGTLLITLLPALLHFGVLFGMGALSSSDLAESPRLYRVVEMAGLTFVGLVRVILGYALCSWVFNGRNAFSAVAESWRLTTRGIWGTAALVFVPRILEIPFRFVTERLPEYALKVDPEWTAVVLAGRILFSTIGTMIALGAVARYYLHAVHFRESGGEA